ncbi:MAG TPA: D-alanyl-D-alanine carboxypeptidase/D-alanyl-D-alanine-endopeptidase [Gemmatimonadales bacterium]|jgi:D-alanyl-D-alanine carboxypeptidase/D-alanyl-D-alanine-endopeptidase (penicillin-binding protein 4)
MSCRAAITALLVAVPAAAHAPRLQAQTTAADVTPVMNAWWTRASHRAPGTWGIVIADQTGKVLWQMNADTPMIPASTAKVLTTGFTRTEVGGDARRATRVIGSGHVDSASGTWVGRWALEMNGDPTLERADRAGPTLEQLAQQLAAIGIRRLVGPLDVTTSSATTVGAPRSIYPAVWSDRFRGRIYAPPIGPITLNENVVSVTVGPGAKLGARPVVIGDAPSGVGSLVEMAAKTVAGRGTGLHFSAGKDGHWVVSGKIGLHGRARRFEAVSTDPTAVLEAVWQHATSAAGIQWTRASGISAPGMANKRVLAEVASATFDSIAHEVNTRSLNIGAEMMLLWGGSNTTPASQLTDFVRKVTGLDGVHMVDGSGLSEEDRVAPIVFTTYLAKIPQTAAGRNFPMLFPANGFGTLRRLASGLPEAGVVRAKTGTLTNVSTLVGYLGRNDGTLIIAAMYNGGAESAAKAAQWDLFRKLGAHGVVVPADLGDDGELGGPNVSNK